MELTVYSHLLLRAWATFIVVVTCSISMVSQANSMPLVFLGKAFSNRPTHFLLAGTVENELNTDQRKAVQRALSFLGHYNGKIDGSFGPGTSAAIKSFQAEVGLATTGTLTSGQVDFLLQREKEEEAKKLATFSNNSSKNSAASRPSVTSKQDGKEALSIDQGSKIKDESTPADLTKLASARNFSGKFGGQWLASMKCNFYKVQIDREIAMRIDGKKVFIDNIAFKLGDKFTQEGSISLDGGWLSNPGDLSVSGNLRIKNIDYNWGILGNFQKSKTLSFKFKKGSKQDSQTFKCPVTFSEGVSEKVEIARAQASKFVGSTEGSDGFLSKIFSQAGSSSDGTLAENSGENNSTATPSVLSSLASITGTASGGGSVMSFVGNIAAVAAGEEAFSGRSALSIYIATSRLLHITTKRAGLGIVKALDALGIKQNKDIPSYLTDIEAVEMPNAFTKQVEERDAEIIKFASDASEEIKEKLSSGFALSNEAKKYLAEAYIELELAKIYQKKVFIGSGLIIANLADANAMVELNAFLQDSGVAMTELPNFFSNVKELFSSFDEITEVAETIRETENMQDVQLAEEEFLENTANQEIDDSVIAELEGSAS